MHQNVSTDYDRTFFVEMRGLFSSFVNVEDDYTPDIPIGAVNLCGKDFSSVNPKNETDEPHDIVDIELCDVEYDRFEKLACYMGHKLKQPDAFLASTQLSEYTCLCKPPPEFMVQMEKLEKYPNLSILRVQKYLRII